MTLLKPLQWNSISAVQFEFELEIDKTFSTIPIKFCTRFLTTLVFIKMMTYLQISLN